MTSISDNTAADLLAHQVGRAKVQAAQKKFGSRHAERNKPFLRTRELFALKGSRYPKLGDAYLHKSSTAQLRYLNSTVDKVPRSKISQWKSPRDIDTLEWFASPKDICHAWAGLDKRATKPALKPLSTILSANDGGLNLDHDKWPSVWFKGGSEPGVLTLGWRATTNDGATVVTVLMAANRKHTIDETTATPELLALSKGAFKLARNS